jgi:hypothetical protein
MRALFTFIVASTVLLLHVMDNPALFKRGWAFAREWANNTFQAKDVRIEGLRALSRTEVERVLPLDRSVVWWMMNMPVIQARVADNPWIGDVSVESCSGGLFADWGCFVVSVSERKARYLAKVDDEAWIIADDGTFLVPLKGLEAGKVDPESLVRLEGLASRSASPDIVRAQVALAKSSVETLQKTALKKVRSLEFGPKGDIVIGFDSVPFPVVFTTSPDSSVSLVEQGDRCAQLFKELGSRMDDVEKIDLAFERVGIVKFKTPPPRAPQRG